MSDNSKKRNIAPWEVCKENIQPIPQGRNMEALMESLSLVNCTSARQNMVKVRAEKFEEDLKEHPEDLSKQLDLWSSYINWLEQHVPDGGKVNGITEALEKCIESYYDKKEFKQDERLFNIFMKFKRFCDEPIEVFNFMYANSICTLLARLYIEWSWQYESRMNLTRSVDLLKLGLNNLASPREILETTEQQLKYRIQKLIQAGELIEVSEDSATNLLRKRETQEELRNSGIRAALQTLKFRITKEKSIKVPINRFGPRAVEQRKVGGLKSQTKIVNGVRVPKTKLLPSSAVATKAALSTTMIRASTSNKPIEIFKDTERATDTENFNDIVGGGDENNVMPKIPTSQHIHLVGRSGQENFP